VSEPEQPTDYLRGYLRLRPGAAVYEISSDELQISFPNYTVTFTSPAVTAVMKGNRSRDTRPEIARQNPWRLLTRAGRRVQFR